MAHENAKKNAKGNQKRLRTFYAVTVVLLVVCFLYKAHWKYSVALSDAERAVAVHHEAVEAAELAAAQREVEEAAMNAGSKKRSKKRRDEANAAAAKADKLLGGSHLIGDGGAGSLPDLDSITFLSYLISFWSLFEAAFWASHYSAALFSLTALGRPTLADPTNPKSEVIECADLSDPKQLGLYSYAQDILWWCWFCQFSYDLVTKYAIALYFPIPCFIAYKIFTGIVSPVLESRSQMAQQQQDDLAKRQEAYLDTHDPKRRLQKRKEEMAAKGKSRR